MCKWGCDVTVSTGYTNVSLYGNSNGCICRGFYSETQFQKFAFSGPQNEYGQNATKVYFWICFCVNSRHISHQQNFSSGLDLDFVNITDGTNLDHLFALHKHVESHIVLAWNHIQLSHSSQTGSTLHCICSFSPPSCTLNKKRRWFCSVVCALRTYSMHGAIENLALFLGGNKFQWVIKWLRSEEKSSHTVL